MKVEEGVEAVVDIIELASAAKPAEEARVAETVTAGASMNWVEF